jgi:hypothetical protein
MFRGAVRTTGTLVLTIGIVLALGAAFVFAATARGVVPAGGRPCCPPADAGAHETPAPTGATTAAPSESPRTRR